MKKDDKKAIDDFLADNEESSVDEKSATTKKIVLDEREGLVERIDKIIVTKDGKQLLREVY